MARAYATPIAVAFTAVWLSVLCCPVFAEMETVDFPPFPLELPPPPPSPPSPSPPSPDPPAPSPPSPDPPAPSPPSPDPPVPSPPSPDPPSPSPPSPDPPAPSPPPPPSPPPSPPPPSPPSPPLPSPPSPRPSPLPPRPPPSPPLPSPHPPSPSPPPPSPLPPPPRPPPRPRPRPPSPSPSPLSPSPSPPSPPPSPLSPSLPPPLPSPSLPPPSTPSPSSPPPPPLPSPSPSPPPSYPPAAPIPISPPPRRSPPLQLPPTYASAPPLDSTGINTFLNSRSDCSLFLSMIQKSDPYVGHYQGSVGGITLFVPNDDAVRRLASDLGFPGPKELLADAASRGVLTQLVNLHTALSYTELSGAQGVAALLLPGQAPVNQSTALGDTYPYQRLKLLLPANATPGNAAALLVQSSSATARVLAYDITYGLKGVVVHIIDTVLTYWYSSVAEAMEQSFRASSFNATLSYVNLTSLLTNSTTNYTVMLPELPQDNDFSTTLSFLSTCVPDYVSRLVLGHVLSTPQGPLLPRAATPYNNTRFDTLSGVPVFMTRAFNGALQVRSRGGVLATVTAVDPIPVGYLSTSVINLVDSILSPFYANVSSALADYTDSLSITAAALGRLSDVSALLTGTTGFTLFAPTNTAWQSYLSSLGLTDVEQVDTTSLRSVLRSHILPQGGVNFTFTALVEGARSVGSGSAVTLRTAGGGDVMLQVVSPAAGDSLLMITRVNGSSTSAVIKSLSDIAVASTSTYGYIHAVDAVMKPRANTTIQASPPPKVPQDLPASSSSCASPALLLITIAVVLLGMFFV